MTTSAIRFVAGLTLSALCCTHALAQNASPRGAFSGVSLGLIFDDGSTSVTSQLSYKGAGIPRSIVPLDFAGTAATPTMPAIPGFSAAKLQEYINTLLTEPVALDIDGMSTGNDLTTLRWDFQINRFVFDPLANASTGAPQWNVLLASVARNAQGADPTSWIYNRQNYSALGPGAEVLGFYVEGSEQLLPDVYDGEVYLEQGAMDFGDTVPLPSGEEQPDIVALDTWMPLILERLGQPDPNIMPNTQYLYFSVTLECAQELRNQQLTVGGVLTPVYGSSILRVKWDGAALSWSDFTVEKQPSDLNLQTDDDIDALAVGARPDQLEEPTGPGGLLGSAKTILGPVYMFSLRNITPNQPQLRVHAQVGDASHTPQYKTGEPVRSNGLSILNGMRIHVGDELDGLCSGDPEAGSALEAIAEPYDGSALPSGPLHLSAQPVVDELGNKRIRIVLSDPGGPSPVPTQVELWISTLPVTGTPIYWTYCPPNIEPFTFDSPIIPPSLSGMDLYFGARKKLGTQATDSYSMRIKL